MVQNSPARDAGAVLSQLAPLFAGSKGTLGELHTLLLRAPERLHHPVRLAVVGQIKKGKSTLVNALIGRQLAATGVLETTFRINEFRYGDREVARAHYRDERLGVPRIEEVPLDALAGLTVRNPARAAELSGLTRIVIDLPEELLLTFELIDTPGLYSVYGEDSENTLAVIGRKRAAELTDASADEMRHADAILYLFSRDLGAADAEEVGRFLGPGGTHAIGAMRALGVVSKCDMVWPPGKASLDYNPVEEVGRQWIRDYQAAEPELGRLFYDIIPVAGLVAEGAQTISAESFNWLNDLSRREPGALLSLLRYRDDFVSAELPGVSLSVQQRTELDRRLGPWGIMLACRYLRLRCTEKEVREHLVTDSGVRRVREQATSQFVGKRAYLIKLDRILTDIRELITIQLPVGHGSADPVAQVRDTVEEITDREQGLWAMDVLRLVGQGRLQLPDTGRLRRLVEPGTSCAVRLGLPEGTPPADLMPAASAEVSYWQRRKTDFPSADPEALVAVWQVLRTAEGIYDRVSRAEQLLREADRLRDQARLLLD